MAQLTSLFVISFCFLLILFVIEAGKRDLPRCQGNFTYTINNQLQEPFFSESQMMCIKDGEKLIYYMEEAVRKKPNTYKNFTATYSSHCGYFIDAINGVVDRYKQNGTFWSILNTTNHPIELGVSSYIPKDGETITFNFTKYRPSLSNVNR